MNIRTFFAGAAIVAASCACGVVAGTASNTTAGTTTTIVSLAVRTDRIAKTLDVTLCNGSIKGSCNVDHTPGAIEVTLNWYVFDSAKVRAAGSATRLWGAADVARMEHTRAVDGTQRSADGKVTWTYHPDHGLNLVITVDEATALPF